MRCFRDETCLSLYKQAALSFSLFTVALYKNLHLALCIHLHSLLLVHSPSGDHLTRHHLSSWPIRCHILEHLFFIFGGKPPSFTIDSSAQTDSRLFSAGSRARSLLHNPTHEHPLLHIPVLGAKNDTITKPPNSPSSTPTHVWLPFQSTFCPFDLRPSQTRGISSTNPISRRQGRSAATSSLLPPSNPPKATTSFKKLGFWILFCGVKLLDTRSYHPSCQTSLSATTRLQPGPDHTHAPFLAAIDPEIDPLPLVNSRV
jgi:hypothetical protein